MLPEPLSDAFRICEPSGIACVLDGVGYNGESHGIHQLSLAHRILIANSLQVSEHNHFQSMNGTVRSHDSVYSAQAEAHIIIKPPPASTTSYCQLRSMASWDLCHTRTLPSVRKNWNRTYLTKLVPVV
ncbi:hypothetical protein TNCV_4490791 [Trichonephila clavipes]|nr:hypothetical protein TNCV_4490791 [Trichonephila clavipes]